MKRLLNLLLVVTMLALSTLACQIFGEETPEATEAPTEAPTEEPTQEPLPPTAEPRPTLPPTEEPPPPPPAADNILLEDNFDDPSSGWEIGDYSDGSVGYGNGFYFVTATRDGGAMWGVAGRDFANVIIEVDATQVQGPANDNNAYGVKCRVQTGESGLGGDGYALMISGDGFYSIQVVTDGNYEPLINWTRSNAINLGNATNHLRAVCEADHMALFVNGQFLGEINDSTYSTGDISLMAATLEPETTEIHFDNILVTQAGR